MQFDACCEHNMRRGKSMRTRSKTLPCAYRLETEDKKKDLALAPLSLTMLVWIVVTQAAVCVFDWNELQTRGQVSAGTDSCCCKAGTPSFG